MPSLIPFPCFYYLPSRNMMLFMLAALTTRSIISKIRPLHFNSFFPEYPFFSDVALSFWLFSRFLFLSGDWIISSDTIPKTTFLSQWTLIFVASLENPR